MAKTKFRPLHDRVVVKRIDAEEKSAGGIIIPDTAKEKPSQGQVVAVGPGGRDEAGKLIPIDIKVGDKVLFGKWSGTEVKLDGEELLIMKESDIMGVLLVTRPLILTLRSPASSTSEAGRLEGRGPGIQRIISTNSSASSFETPRLRPAGYGAAPRDEVTLSQLE